MNFDRIKQPLARSVSLKSSLVEYQEPVQRIAIIAAQSQIEAARGVGNDTLVVASDWLLWQKCVALGIPCIYYEVGLQISPEDPFGSNLHVLNNSWVYEEDEDATTFEGVSLGKQFIRHVSPGMVFFERLTKAITAIVKRYNPAEIIYFGYRAELDVAAEFVKCEMVRALAEAHGATFKDRSKEYPSSDSSSPIQDDAYSPPKGPTNRSRIVDIYCHFMDLICTLLQRVRPARNIVFLLLGADAALPVIDATPAMGPRPIWPARLLPKSPARILQYLRKGVLLCAIPKTTLTEDETIHIQKIRDRLLKRWAGDRSPSALNFRQILIERVLPKGVLEEMACDVKAARSVLVRWKPKAIVAESVQGPPSRIFLEVAQTLGIKTIHIHHSVFAQDLRLELLCGDGKKARPVDYSFSWGSTNDSWLRNIGAKCNVIRTGAPKLSGKTLYLSPDRHRDADCVVILQHTPILNDFSASYASQFEYFIETARAVRARSTKKIIFKLHPGICNDAYFVEIAELFGLDCEIVRHGSLYDLVQDAEYVIGPAYSGGMLEILTAGVPYLPVSLQPSSINPTYFSTMKVVTRIEDIAAALDAGAFAPAKETLDAFCGIPTINDPAEEFWKAVGTVLDSKGSAVAAPPMQQKVNVG